MVEWMLTVPVEEISGELAFCNLEVSLNSIVCFPSLSLCLHLLLIDDFDPFASGLPELSLTRIKSSNCWYKQKITCLQFFFSECW